MTTHACMSSPGLAPGDQFDCPACRAVLLRAFREPVQAPGEGAPVDAGQDTGCLEPELCTTSDPCPVCESAREGHDANARAFEYPYRPGTGTWSAWCSCGWFVTGPWGVPGGPRGLGEARDIAHQWAQRHRDNPLREGP